MKILLTFEGQEEKIVLPLQHNHFVQAAIYQLLDPMYASFLHREGYTYNNRQFRLFSFSRLLGQYAVNPQEGTITFIGPIKLVILTPIPNLSSDIINSLILGKEFRIGQQKLFATAVEVDYPQTDKTAITIRTLSPIVSYSTMERPDGRKFTYYFEPAETEFSQLVSANLFKKYNAWQGGVSIKEEELEFSIKPLRNIKRNIVMYKGIVIKGYSGLFIIKGEQRYLEFALNVGLGSKNSQGFGAVEIN